MKKMKTDRDEREHRDSSDQDGEFSADNDYNLGGQESYIAEFPLRVMQII